MADEVRFSKGPSNSLPSDKVPGRILIETDTGKMHLDVDSSQRIDIGGLPGEIELPETTLTVNLASDTSEKFDGTKDVDLGVKNVLPTKHGGLGNDKGYVQTGSFYPTQGPGHATVIGKNNLAVGDCGLTSGEGCVCFGDNCVASGYYSCAGGVTDKKLILGSTQGESGGQIVFDQSYYFNMTGSATIGQVLKSGDIIHTVLTDSTDSDVYVGAVLEVSEVVDNGLSLVTPSIVTCQVLVSDPMSSLVPPIAGTYNVIQNNDTAHSNNCGAEGQYCRATGDGSYAGGFLSNSYGKCSYAFGKYCFATGDYAYAIGLNSQAHNYQFVCGRYAEKANDGPTSESDMTGNLFKVGNGTSSSAEANAFRIATSGAVYGNGAYNSSGADYAEMFEWADGNPDNEDRRGLFVTLDGEKIRLAQSGEYILGAISSTPAVLGDSYFGDNWHNMYQKDVFNQIVKYKSDDGSLLTQKDNSNSYEYKLNVNYDPEQTYIPRSERPEWACVGMLGKLIVVDDGSCQINQYCTCGPNGIATKSDHGYRVMARIDENHIKILLRNSK